MRPQEKWQKRDVGRNGGDVTWKVTMEVLRADSHNPTFVSSLQLSHGQNPVSLGCTLE